MKPSSMLLAFILTLAIHARADVVPNILFSDNAVLQQEMKVPIWGTAAPGEKVRVEFAGQTVTGVAGADGKWLVYLAPIKAGGPYTLAVSGRNTVQATNVLVGEVWLCSGQSNMERQLGSRAGQKPITNVEREIAEANYPQIRHFGVEQTKSFAPVQSVKGAWLICSPATVKDFTAVGYFFGRDLFKARGVPIGLLHSSWGGTPAEAWSSESTLRGLTDFAPTLDLLKRVQSDPQGARREYANRLELWFGRVDPGSHPGATWSAHDLDTASWKEMTLPTLWESVGEPDLDGVVWFRKNFDLPDNFAATDAELDLGMIDDMDTTWVNGVQVGALNGYQLVRKYPVPAGVLKPGRNVIAVRVLDTGGGGGLYGGDKLQLVFKNEAGMGPVPLSGPWQYRVTVNLKNAPWPPTSITENATAPTVLYNGMIAPLLPFAMRGVIWYQGEANVGRERQYRTLFPAMIAGWRQAWGEGDFPFLFVQIAPFSGMTPEIREAQFLSWQSTRNTAMVVTTDCGDPVDIHPAHKQPVGARLALAARALAYHERIEYSGPEFESMSIKGTNAVLRFRHLGGGLASREEPMKGFTIAGSDKNFVPAHAEIHGKAVVVTSPDVAHPAAVRYGWANVPEGNLINKAGLPASPFRTDTDPE
ncbi:MAG TPA: sialate O-acetylesterase [Verrucomicrobiae bacterium]|nr:sialate O-acetylesterase [Verrucomicrobiae bacterium]